MPLQGTSPKVHLNENLGSFLPNQTYLADLASWQLAKRESLLRILKARAILLLIMVLGC
jgi:hypothetical protein